MQRGVLLCLGVFLEVYSEFQVEYVYKYLLFSYSYLRWHGFPTATSYASLYGNFRCRSARKEELFRMKIIIME